MAWRLGRIQRGCLRVIEEYEATGKRPTTFNIAAEVYRVRRDPCGNLRVSDAQYFSTERALALLSRKGLVTGRQHFELVRSLLNGRSERCILWSITRRPLERTQGLNGASLREGLRVCRAPVTRAELSRGYFQHYCHGDAEARVTDNSDTGSYRALCRSGIGEILLSFGTSR